MNTLQVAQSCELVAAFTAIGRDTIDNGTLSRSIWGETLEELEAGIADFEMLPQHAGSVARVVALQHYFAVYEAAASAVILSRTQWSKWRTGLGTVYAPASPQIAEEMGSVEAVRVDLVLRYHALAAVQLWGTFDSLEARYTTLEHHIADAQKKIDEEEIIASEKGEEDEEGEPERSTIAAVQRKHFAILNTFSHLAYDARHLFEQYAQFGQLERSWMEETLVANATDDITTAAAEPLLRASYKRDMQIPSKALEADLVDEYEEYEIDDIKKREILKLRDDTLKSEWYAAAHRLSVHVQVLCESRNADDKKSDVNAAAMVLDTRGEELADAVVRIARKAAIQGSYIALALTMQRVIEYEAFPGVMNPSRVEFALHLLHEWLPQYVGKQHRWGVEKPFTNADDTDLWQFVLDRHEVLLRWALMYAQIHLTGSDLPARECLRTRNEQAVESMRMVATSLLHSWQLYIATTARAHVNAEKQAERHRRVASMMQTWVQERFVKLFAGGLLNDLYNDLEVCGYEEADTKESEANNGDDLENQTAILLLESNLKLLLCEVLAFVNIKDSSGSSGGGDNSVSKIAVAATRKRLCPLVEGLLEHLRVLFTEHHSSTSCTTSSLSSSQQLFRACVRCLRVLCGTASATSSLISSESASLADYLAEEKQFAVFMHGSFKELLLLAPHSGDVALFEDVVQVWMEFLCSGPRGESSGRLATYQLLTGEPLMDVSFGKRKGMKLLKDATVSSAVTKADEPAQDIGFLGQKRARTD